MKKTFSLSAAVLLSMLTVITNCLTAQKYVVDSLAGFDYVGAAKHASFAKTDKEKNHFMKWAKRRFIDEKYSLTPGIMTAKIPSPTVDSIMQQGSQPANCTNIDFESGNTSSWTLSGDFALMTSGNDPYGNFPRVFPGGGTTSLRLNDDNITNKVNFLATAQRVITVGASNNFLNLHFALDILNYPHTATDAAKFSIQFLNSSNQVLACPQFQCYYYDNGTGGQAVGISNFQQTPGSPGLNIGNQAYPVSYAPWQTVGLDLTPYIGQTITIKVICDWCVYDYDWAYCYIDADCFSAYNPTNASCGNLPFNLCGPTGMQTYTWTPPGGGASISNTTCCNATVPGIYTLQCKPYATCGASTITYTYNIQPAPTANFSYTLTPCQGAVPFLSTSTTGGGPAINTYVWQWNDGSPNGSGTGPAHTFTSSGTQTVQLVVTSASGCKDSVVKTFNLVSKPTANFNYTNTCVGGTINYANTSTPAASITLYSWNYGDGSPGANTQNTTHSYASSGTYTTTLIVGIGGGCNDTIKKVVTVYGKPVANFTTTPVCFGTANSFTNSTSTSVNPFTGAIASYSWNFGNGASSASQNPTNTYNAISNSTLNTTYSVTLYATTVDGCKDSITKTVLVYSNPTPDFLADTVCFGNATTFLDASNSNGNPFLLFGWDWDNDGVLDLTTNSLSSTHTFTSSGSIPITYTVVTSPNGGVLNCINSITKNIWVDDGPIAAITNTNQCLDTQPVIMSGASSSISAGSIANYAWSYGDGSTSNTNAGPTTTYSYAASGVYIVTLTCTSANGCSSSTTKAVEVWELPNGDLGYSKTCYGQTTTLSAVSLNTNVIVANFGWDLNNTPVTAEANGAVVTNTFNSAGQQTITLLMTSDKGCKNSVTRNVYINYNPKPNFYAPKRSGCTDLCINIQDSSAAITGPAANAQWEWTFGNGQTIITSSNATNKICYSNPSHVALSRYDVKLILRTDSGCVDSIKKKNYITVYPNPLANFTWEGVDGDVLTPNIKFTNTSEGYTKFEWYFNDGINVSDSIHANPTHYFDTEVPASYNVYLAVKNSFGCKDTIMKPIDIGPNFTFYVPNTFTPNEDGVNDYFTGIGVGIKEFKMWIFDRWGEAIYYTGDITKGWPGTVKGKTVEGKTDVYQYKIIVTDYKGKDHQYVGHVTELK